MSINKKYHKVMNDLDFVQVSTLLESIKSNRTIDWTTGEGIDWISVSKEEVKRFLFLEDTCWKEEGE
jgi:hypothetical protein